jgi:hypothetical protein
MHLTPELETWARTTLGELFEPDVQVKNNFPNVRHACPKARQVVSGAPVETVSTTISLRWHAVDHPTEPVRLIYLSGKCVRCKQTARSVYPILEEA